MDNLKSKLTGNPSMKCVVGLRDSTPSELKDIKIWLKAKSIKYYHKRAGLPFNGVLQINLK